MLAYGMRGVQSDERGVLYDQNRFPHGSLVSKSGDTYYFCYSSLESCFLDAWILCKRVR